MPICFDGAALGVFCVARMTFDEPFAPMHARALQVLATHCGVSIFRSLHERRIQTERGEAQAALLDSEKRYRRFFEHNIAGTYISTPVGRILDCNTAFARMLGLASVEEALSADVASLYPDADAHQTFLEQLRAQRSVDRRESVLRRADGESIHVIETAVGMFGPQGDLMEIHGYVIDDTERRRAREQLRLSQKMEAIGRLTGGIAHTFNNMLTAIMGSADMILARVGEDHPAHSKADGIKKAAARAATLTRQLLAFSRQQALQPKVLDLGVVVAEMEDMLRQVLGAGIEITVVPGSALGRVKADPGQIQQILLNLALNARDAMPDGGRLTIETANVDLDDAYAIGRDWAIEPGPYVRLAVTDTGCGMDAETQTHAFEPFFTTKSMDKASGLGLSTVYGIIKQSGGHIDLESEPGRGTSIKIHLPRVAAVVVSFGDVPCRAGGGRGGGTVLVVDDEDLVRAVIRDTLLE